MNYLSLYVWGLVAFAIVFMMIVEPLFYDYLELRIKILFIEIWRFLLIMRLYPRLILTKWMMERRMKKILKETQKN